MCSEYAALLQNLLSVFGYQTIYIHGEVDNEDHKNTRHAYNLSIIDISLPIMCYDYKKGSNKGNFPYICCLDDFNNDKLNEFLSGEKELELDELRTQIINNEIYTFGKPKQRVYKIDKLQSDD